MKRFASLRRSFFDFDAYLDELAVKAAFSKFETGQLLRRAQLFTFALSGCATAYRQLASLR